MALRRLRRAADSDSRPGRRSPNADHRVGRAGLVQATIAGQLLDRDLYGDRVHREAGDAVAGQIPRGDDARIVLLRGEDARHTAREMAEIDGVKRGPQDDPEGIVD